VRVGDELPKGTFTFLPPKPDQQFTLVEITDFVNEALLAQKWLLIRQEKTFAVVPADEKVDPKLVRRVELSELDKYGRTELVEILIVPSGVLAADLLDPVRKLSGPFGAVVANGGERNMLVIRDTVGNLKRIVEVIRKLEAATEKKPGE
jgi:hypothetical protein